MKKWSAGLFLEYSAGSISMKNNPNSESEKFLIKHDLALPFNLIYRF